MSHPSTDEQFEEIARLARREFGLEFVERIDMMTLINKIKVKRPGFQYSRQSDQNMPDAEAQWISDNNTIAMRESVFTAMQRGEGRARFTVAHEISHYLLGHDGTRNRSINKTSLEKYVNSIKREEAEASRLASKIIAPAYLITDNDTAADIQFKFGLSFQAAAIRRDEVNDLNRRAEGKLRPLPSVVVDFLKEARSRGHNVTARLDD